MSWFCQLKVRCSDRRLRTAAKNEDACCLRRVLESHGWRAQGWGCRLLHVWVMQTQLFQSSIKEAASVESVQLGVCDRASWSNLPVIVRELAIHLCITWGPESIWGFVQQSLHQMVFLPPPPGFCGCAVVFLCLLNQHVVLWSSSVSGLPPRDGYGSRLCRCWKQLLTY